MFLYLSDTGNRGHNVLVFFGLVPNVLVGNAYRAVWYDNACDGELNLHSRSGDREREEIYEGEWLDIGTPQRLELLNAQLINQY